VLPKGSLIVAFSLLATANYQSAGADQRPNVTLEGGIGFVQACGDGVEASRFVLTDLSGKKVELDFPGEIVASYGGAFELPSAGLGWKGSARQMDMSGSRVSRRCPSG
jgi:hypothetical protein